MFSLIITIIAVAIVAVLAIATIYYGADIYEGQRTKAGAAQIINETEQIEGAILAYNIEKGTAPVIQDCTDIDDCEPLQELIDSGYLASAPAKNAGSDEKWAMATIYSDGTDSITALVKTVPVAECLEANTMMGFKGITAYNASISTDPDYATKALSPSESAEAAGVDSNMIPECNATMPSNLVCCETVTTTAS